MKPRVFVSSTYYDLKYLRERIEKFLFFYGFDTVLFESNNVTYEHGRAIDVSVYRELETCHMMILIVGGRYGSAISNEQVSKEDQKRYDDEYVSITRKEFETAVEKNIPIFIFIDKNVYSDYENYTKNTQLLENLLQSKTKGTFQFAHVDSINVFKFINNLISKPIKTFDKAEEIESYLQSQLAGMFFLYLQSLQKEEENKKILNSVEELNNVTKLMSEMLGSVGKKILENDAQEYEKVIDRQFEILLDYFVASLDDYIQIVSASNTENDREISSILAKLIYDLVLSEEYTFNDDKTTSLRKLRAEKDIQIKQMLNEKIKVIDSSAAVEKIWASLINRNYYQNVKPFIKNKVGFSEIIINKMREAIYLDI